MPDDGVAVQAPAYWRIATISARHAIAAHSFSHDRHAMAGGNQLNPNDDNLPLTRRPV